MGEKEKDVIIRGLRETILSQQKLLHKLYTELDAERESSSTAATEAMSMILRLQEEKAAEMLQATQFKRLIQQKMDHANRVSRHKDFHIASLEFQIQAYHYKMLSLGLTPAPPANGNLTRIHSLPAIQFKDEKYNSYWEQIKELDERVDTLNSQQSSSSLYDVFEVPQNNKENLLVQDDEHNLTMDSTNSVLQQLIAKLEINSSQIHQQSEITGEKSHTSNQPSLVSLMEEMFFYSL